MSAVKQAGPSATANDRCMRSRTTLAVTIAALLFASTAAATEVATPDGRARVAAEPEVAEDSLAVGAGGNAGAVGFTTGAEATAADGGAIRVDDPPMYDSFGTDGNSREELYGPPVARAALGTGGLTASFRGDGALSNLSWPGPGLFEHVNYRQTSRDWRNAGAPENAGSFGGLLLPDGTGTWFTEPEGWAVEDQSYEGTESGVLRTVLRRDGITVTVRDVVHPTLDILARSFDVAGAPAGSRIAYFANMNPTTTRTPRVPSTTDGAADDASDFATLFDAGRDAMLHFRPYTLDPSAPTPAATGALSSENAAAAVDATYGTGVYVAVGADQPVAEHQAGLETLGAVRQEAEGTPLLDPFYDARDGRLSGSAAAFGKTAGAQAWDSTSVTVFIAAAESAAAATDALDATRGASFERFRQAAEVDWRSWIRQARLPAVDDDQAIAVAKRSLMLIRTAQDRRTGAIVANTTTQTPYRQDWLRDGAFFNYALLVAGYTDMVERHNDFYRRAQSATGHWDPILCTDGAHCSAVFPFEIDAQAFGVWSLVAEWDFTGNRERLEQSWDAIRRGTAVLEACRDPRNGLQCYAAEDDAVQPTQGTQGAATVYLALRAAARAAAALGHQEDARRWNARADELQQATVEHLCTPTCPLNRGTNYLVWPSKLLVDAQWQGLQPLLDRRGRGLASDMSFATPKPGGFFQYPMERIFGLATAWSPTDEHRLLLEQSTRWLAHDVAEPGVLHFGERIFHLGDGRYLHSVGFPHIWSGAETYLAAALVHGVGGCDRTEQVGDVTCRGSGAPAAAREAGRTSR